MTALASADPVTWIDIQKTFGPVAIQKVGFSYSSGSLSVLANLSLATGGLEIDLIGIGISSPITHPFPHFTIEGLAVSFQEGPISVMGGMTGTLDPPNFVGALSVRAPELALAAFAGYAEYEGHPSFFLYGVLDIRSGGRRHSSSPAWRRASASTANSSFRTSAASRAFRSWPGRRAAERRRWIRSNRWAGRSKMP